MLRASYQESVLTIFVDIFAERAEHLQNDVRCCSHESEEHYNWPAWALLSSWHFRWLGLCGGHGFCPCLQYIIIYKLVYLGLVTEWVYSDINPINLVGIVSGLREQNKNCTGNLKQMLYKPLYRQKSSFSREAHVQQWIFQSCGCIKIFLFLIWRLEGNDNQICNYYFYHVITPA